MTAPTRRYALVISLAAGVMFAAACSADDPAPPPAVAATPSVAASTTAAPAPTTPPPASKKPGVLKLGQKQVVSLNGYTVEVAALRVTRGEDYEGVQVRTCNKGPEVGVSRLPWMLGYDSFEQLHDIDTSGGGLPAPAYPDRDLAEGECTKGWVNFTSVPGEKPDGIQYKPEGAEPIRWSF